MFEAGEKEDPQMKQALEDAIAKSKEKIAADEAANPDRPHPHRGKFARRPGEPDLKPIE